MRAFLQTAFCVLTGICALDSSAALAQQTQPPVPAGETASDGTPTWKWRIQVKDGRTFVTDGAFAIDAAIARPAVLPTAIPATVDRFLEAPFEHEFGARDLTAALRHYATPNGVTMNSKYVDYLKRLVAARQLRFRVATAREPVVVAVDGKPIAVLMPMAR